MEYLENLRRCKAIMEEHLAEVDKMIAREEAVISKSGEAPPKHAEQDEEAEMGVGA